MLLSILASGSLLTQGKSRGMAEVTRQCPGVCDDATCALPGGTGSAGGLRGPLR